MLFYYALAAPGSSFIRRFKVQAEFLWAEFLMNARLRAARILLVVYVHHVTSKSRDVHIYARVVHFNNHNDLYSSSLDVSWHGMACEVVTPYGWFSSCPWAMALSFCIAVGFHMPFMDWD